MDVVFDPFNTDVYLKFAATLQLNFARGELLWQSDVLIKRFANAAVGTLIEEKPLLEPKALIYEFMAVNLLLGVSCKRRFCGAYVAAEWTRLFSYENLSSDHVSTAFTYKYRCTPSENYISVKCLWLRAHAQTGQLW